MGLLAAAQGGYLLAQASHDVTPMASAIDMALAHLHMLDSKRDPQRPLAEALSSLLMWNTPSPQREETARPFPPAPHMA